MESEQQYLTASGPVLFMCLGMLLNKLHLFSRTQHRFIKVFYSPTNAQVLKTILKFTLKQLRHVSVQSHHHQEAHYSCLIKLFFIISIQPLGQFGQEPEPQSGDRYGSGMLHPGQVLRGSLPLLSR